MLWCSDVGNRITELNKAVGRVHAEMQDHHQKLNWQNKGEPDQANILGKYILGAKNNFRDFNKNEPVKCENTVLQISTHEKKEEKEADNQEGGDVSVEREEETGFESPTETLPEEEMTFETVSTHDESETNTKD